LKHRLESAEDHLRYDENWIPELEILYEYHDAKARLRGLIDIDMDLSEGLGLDATIDEIAYAAKERHRTLENSELEPLYREYVFNERLFLWGEETTRYARATQYRFIYDVANLNTATLDEVTRDTLDGWVRWLALEGSDFENVSNILHRIGLFIECFGYEHFIEDTTQSGGQWGRESGIGSNQPVNLITGKESKIYHGVVLGLASGLENRSRQSFQNILHATMSHLHRSDLKTKTVLILTDVWDREVIRQFVPDLMVRQNHGTTFLFLLVNGRRLIPMELSFS